MRSVEASATTREEAIQNALQELGVEMYEVDKIDILDEGSKGMFGFGVRTVKVRLTVENMAPLPPAKPQKQETAQKQEQPRAAKPEQKADARPQRPQKQEQKPDNRPARPEQKASPRPQSPQRPDRPQRPEQKSDSRPARPERPVRQDRSEQSDLPDRPQRPQRQDRPEPQRADTRPARPQRQDRPQRPDRPEQNADDTRPVRPQRPERPERPDRPERPQRPVRENRDEQRPRNQEEDAAAALTDDQGKEAAALLQEVITKMGMAATTQFLRGEDGIPRLDVSTEDSALLIGRKGNNLNAMQYLINRMISRGDANENTERVVVDVEGYVDRRREMIEEMARGMAERAKANRRSIRMKPMSPQERRIVHVTLQEDPDIRTYSLGESLYRCVVISPKDARDERGPRGGRGQRGGDDRGGRGGDRGGRNYSGPPHRRNYDPDPGQFGD